MPTYTIAITTGDKGKAGTNARVYMCLTGTAGSTPDIRLDHPNYNDFRRNITDSFQMSLSDIGDPTKIRLWHDNSGSRPGWYVERVKVTRHTDGKSWHVDCKTWFATSTGDGKIDRTFQLQAGAGGAWVFGIASAKVISGQSTAANFTIDDASRGIRVELFQGATSALLMHGGSYQYFAAGEYTLYEGGAYTLQVGTWYAGPGDVPEARVWYMSRQ